MVNKNNSPYSATITGCAFLYNEFMRILPLLMAENVESLLKEEVQNNRLLQVNSQKRDKHSSLSSSVDTMQFQLRFGRILSI